MNHRMYYYNTAVGSMQVPSAKCLCGAECIGEEAIAAHAAEIE